MNELVIATRNNKKKRELIRLLNGFGIKVLSLDDFDNLPKVKEDGDTFKANAAKKALAISSRIDKLVMADDSGIEIEALGNAPGVHSARYAGLAQNDIKNNKKVINQMRSIGSNRRNARFRCVICLAKGKRIIGFTEGKVEGRIAFAPKGKTGFGYDPIFIPKGYKKTFAELGPKIKDRLSHRGKALKKAKKIICGYFK